MYSVGSIVTTTMVSHCLLPVQAVPCGFQLHTICKYQARIVNINSPKNPRFFVLTPGNRNHLRH